MLDASIKIVGAKLFHQKKKYFCFCFWHKNILEEFSYAFQSKVSIYFSCRDGLFLPLHVFLKKKILLDIWFDFHEVFSVILLAASMKCIVTYIKKTTWKVRI